MTEIQDLVRSIPREQRFKLAEMLYKDLKIPMGEPIDLEEVDARNEINGRFPPKNKVESHPPKLRHTKTPVVEVGAVDKEKLEQSARLMLEAIGEDPSRDGLKDTPKRFANYWSVIMNGHFLRPEDYVTEFDNDGHYDGAVVLKGLPFYTVCEHHLAPFLGEWDVAYKPGDHILGLSKLVRIARVFQKRPQVQERLTKQIADSLNEILRPEWVVVRMNAEHFCMSTRGVRTPGAMTETLTGHGDYPKDIFGV